MGHERWIRGQHDGQKRPFDWLTAARQHGIPDKLARALYEQARQQAHGTSQGPVQEMYLALLAAARREAARPSPGKVTRTMRVQAERAGKKPCRSHTSSITGQPVAPGKRTLTTYLEPPANQRHGADLDANGFPHEARPAGETARARAAVFGDSHSMPVVGEIDATGVMLRKILRADGGEPLPESIRRELEQRLGMDLTQVRLHTSEDETMPLFTIGRSSLSIGWHIFVWLHDFERDLASGMHLLADELAQMVRQQAVPDAPERGNRPTAHELAHIVEQNASDGQRAGRRALETEADWAASASLAAQPAVVSFDVTLGTGMDAAWVIQAGNAVRESSLAHRIDRKAESDERPDERARAALERASQSKGEPLPDGLREALEQMSGADLSGVRVHTGAASADAARAIQAHAFTMGQDVYFAPGQYQPHSAAGRELIAHEVAHTLQQRSLPAAELESARISDPRDGDETAANAFAHQFERDWAHTVGPHGGLATEHHRPDSVEGTSLMAHERAHGVQQGATPPPVHAAASMKPPLATAVVHRAGPEASEIEVELISSRDAYQPPGSRETYRMGDAAASRILMDILEGASQVIFRVFNFETGAAEEMSPAQWSFFRGAAIIGGSNAGITRLGRQLSPSRWRSLWPNPMPELLRMFEAHQITLEDDALLSGYRGMIRSDAARSLDENERAIDALLGAPDRVQRIQEYATGLREASLVRDALVQRRDELSRRLVAQHSFTFGLPHAGTGPNVAQRMQIGREQAEIEDTLTFWLSAFPLLTRLQTHEIGAAPIEARLREIKANIVATRAELDRGRPDPMTLDMVRARLAGQLGPRAAAVVEAEDRSRARWAVAGAVVAMAASIGILFLPGGIFIDAAIGVAIAGHAIANAEALGRAANTGLHVDDGLVSQSQAQEARFGAVLSTVFAVVGAAAAGFRVLRVGLALRGLRHSMPELALAERASVARAIAGDQALFSTFTQMAPGDAAVIARVAAAVRHAGGDVRALRTALVDVARIAAIPRRIPASPDLYEPLRRIVDGSDIERIASQTGLSRAEVEAAKRNLMLDEHILVDGQTGALYRGRFDPFEEVARPWSRAARGEALRDSERDFLRRLVRHEQAEGALLSAGGGRTLEQAFLRGELEGMLRSFLQRNGRNQAQINQMLALESRPITPYRYAHIVAHFSGAPNP